MDFNKKMDEIREDFKNALENNPSCFDDILLELYIRTSGFSKRSTEVTREEIELGARKTIET